VADVRVAGFALLLLVSAALAATTTSKAAFPGRNGLIAYEVDGSLCLMSASGSAKRRLTFNSWLDTDPAWSADGRKLAFTQTEWEDNPYERGTTIGVLTGGTRRLVRAAQMRDPAWSPDGQLLVFTVDVLHAPAPSIAIMDPAESTSRLLQERAAHPAWSPDGGVIAFHRPQSSSDRAGLYAIRPDGSGLRRLADNGFDPSWSPDGSKLAFEDRGWLALIDRDGGGFRRLVQARAFQSGISWSPDGKEIAFARDADIWAVDAETGQARNLTKTPSLTERAPDWGTAANFPLPRGGRGCGHEIVDHRNEGIGILVGGRLDDLAYGLEGRDRIRGNGGHDVLYGGRGADLLVGGSGRDVLKGGGGRDMIGAKDGERDDVLCGRGVDRVIADQHDRVAEDCERVARR
jgi:Tol biopolymer transport system component